MLIIPSHHHTEKLYVGLKLLDERTLPRYPVYGLHVLLPDTQEIPQGRDFLMARFLQQFWEHFVTVHHPRYFQIL